MAEPLDWPTVKERWEAGEDERSIAVACRRKVVDIQAMAVLEAWSNKRRPTLARTKPEGKAKQAAIVLTERTSTLSDRVELDVDPAELAESLDAQSANAHHLHDHEALRRVALKLLTVAAGTGDARLLTAVANALKTAQVGQRLSLGLSNETTQTPTPGAGLVMMPKKDLPSAAHRLATESGAAD